MKGGADGFKRAERTEMINVGDKSRAFRAFCSILENVMLSSSACLWRRCGENKHHPDVCKCASDLRLKMMMKVMKATVELRRTRRC